MAVNINGLFPGELSPDATVAGCIDIFEKVPSAQPSGLAYWLALRFSFGCFVLISQDNFVSI